MSLGPPRTIALATLDLVPLACSESGAPAPASTQPGGLAAAGPDQAAPNPRDLRARLARLESELGPRLDLGRR